MLLDRNETRLGHIVDAMNQALQYARSRTRSDVEADIPLQHVLARNIEIIGEAASRLTPEFRAAHPQIPWPKMIGMRNRMIHEYFDIDVDIVWGTVIRDFPVLLPQLQRILEEN